MNSDELFERLEKYGADVKGIMERFMGDAELYGECLCAFMADESFERLGAAIKERDLQKAFYEAHTIKGVTGNLGLAPLCDPVNKLVELLRSGECGADEIEARYAEALARLEEMKEALAQPD